jgi:mycothiol synthase
MTLTIEEQQVFMYRPDLTVIRKATLPAGYLETPVTPDLHSSWAKVLDQVLGGIDINRPPLVESPRWRDDRAILVMKDSLAVAACIGWDEPSLWPRTGQVFFTAVLEEHRRLGLGAFVVSHLLEQFAREGLSDAILSTEEYRLPAIELYLKLGFRPLITGKAPDERQRWERVSSDLNKPEVLRWIWDDYSQITAASATMETP